MKSEKDEKWKGTGETNTVNDTGQGDMLWALKAPHFYYLFFFVFQDTLDSCLLVNRSVNESSTSKQRN